MGGLDHAQTGADRSRRAVEHAENAVPSGLDQTAAIPLDLSTHGLIVTIEQRHLRSVTDRGCVIGRADNVSEKDRGQDAVGDVSRLEVSEELLDRQHCGPRIGEGKDVIVAGKDDEPRPGMFLARNSASLNSFTWSPSWWMTSVGTSTNGKTGLTSISRTQRRPIIHPPG